MFHTVLLFQPIQAIDYPIIKSILEKLSDEQNSRRYRDKRCPDLNVYTLYGSRGITILLRRTLLKGPRFSCEKYAEEFSSGIYYHAIEIRLNPKALIQKREYVKVAKASEFPQICDRFKEALKPLQERVELSPLQLFYKLNAIDEYQVKRIDYCINIRTVLHEAYMELISRADIPAHFYLVTELDKKSGRQVAYKNSFYIQTKGHSVGVNIYNKEYQMQSEFADYERLEDANQIIRIEIQCLNGKTNSLKQKLGWRYRDCHHFMNEELSRKLIYDYYEKTVGFEDYYTLEEAKRMIQGNTQYKSKTINKMIEVLLLINQKRSIHKAKMAYSEDATELKRVEAFNALIKKIKKSGINPVTIPVNWGYRHIPNLVEEMDKEFTQLLRVVVN
ncbi:hypothetical protein [Paenibacillus thalictri]|uniref:Uncharacterized protein n=1 Tax=Paenibacillus thalictri TaxID=2527873 RepID=A0A4Q9DV18_9BACL|nr:hypothetical protein [Paenibacillus thalictri]TBL80874.1 hypothetical protein EYB31_06560 [Paenibacillus thalictri]